MLVIVKYKILASMYTKIAIVILVALPFFGFTQYKEPDSTSYHIQSSHQFNLGVGLLNTEDFALSLFGGSSAGDPSPSLVAEYLYGLTDRIAIGAHTSFYRVNAQQAFNLDDIGDITDDPACAIACLTGIDLGGDCDCTGAGMGNQEADIRVSSLTLGVKGVLHFFRFKGIDTYTSFVVGYSFNKQKSLTANLLDSVLEQANLDQSVPSVVYAGSAGLRYYIDPKWGIYGEYGIANVHTLKLGLTYRIY